MLRITGAQPTVTEALFMMSSRLVQDMAIVNAAEKRYYAYQRGELDLSRDSED